MPRGAGGGLERVSRDRAEEALARKLPHPQENAGRDRTGPIMLDEVQCLGTEPSLANCSSLGWLRSKCRHNQDAGVICSNEPGSTVTMEVDAECLPVVTDFIRYFYSRRIDVALPTVKCLHKLASVFGAQQLQAYCAGLFAFLLPEDLSFQTALDLHAYALATRDPTLEELREKGAAPGDVEGLVREVRFPMIPPEDLFQLQSNLSLYRSHRALFQEQTLQALEFHTVPLPLLAQLRGLNLSQDAYQPRLYTSPTWSWAVARSSRDSSRPSYDSYPYRYGSYPKRYDRYDRYGRYGPTSAPTGYFQTPQHPSFLFRNSRISWTLIYLPTVQSCWNYGFSCSSDEVPVLGLSKSGSSDPTIGYENKALMLCGGRFVADVTAFEGGKAEIPSALNANSSRRASFFPCPAGSFSSFRGVIRPFYLTNSSGVD
ncbi:Galectin-3-binding protein [Myotis brandtii]|uniref:Galectin-3-binding protein n=1 Tax=Myotis brandtii TaxID=109478 RepID=S7Q6C8_MYOBR|nr:Galectin-3-binding protein [Myotis brandtii]